MAVVGEGVGKDSQGGGGVIDDLKNAMAADQVEGPLGQQVGEGVGVSLAAVDPGLDAGLGGPPAQGRERVGAVDDASRQIGGDA